MYTNLSFLPHQLGFASHVHGKVPGCNTDPTKVHYDTSQCYTKKQNKGNCYESDEHHSNGSWR